MSSHDHDDRPMATWRSLADLQRGEAEDGAPTVRSSEFEPGADELEVGGSALSRRRFFSLVGAGATLAGLTPLAGCVRQPEEHILPYAQRPEDLIPGKPRTYATSAKVGGGVLGLLVESQDGRPTKIEGLPLHPMSQGAASAWAQAEVLSIYDPERSRLPRRLGKESSWDAFADFAAAHFGALRKQQGRGLALLVEHQPSPTFHRLLRELQRQLPQAALYLHDETFPRRTHEGVSMVHGSGLPLLAPDRANVVLALDSDLLGLEGDVVRNLRLYARRRQVLSPRSTMNRLYVVEPALTQTGAAADHRLRLRSSEVESFTLLLLVELLGQGAKLPVGAEGLKQRLPKAASDRFGRWLPALARDLVANQGNGLVVVGERQPPRMHALGLLLNAVIGSLGRTITIAPQPEISRAGTLEELCAALRAGRVQTLLALGGDPVYQAPAELELGRLVGTARERIHLATTHGETSRLCTWHLPITHFLEAWGDWRASDGSLSLQQPLIAPLHRSRSAIEVLAQVLGEKLRGYELVRQTWQRERPGADFEKRWRRWLHDGVISPPPTAEVAPLSLDFGALLAGASAEAPTASPQALEASFHLDASVLDGRYAGNAWLQELPDPITKVTWDNAACLAPATAAALGVSSFDQVELSVGGRTAKLAALVVPGTVENTVVLPLGYGQRESGELARAGVDVGPLRSARAPWYRAGVTLKRLGRRRPLAITQEHGSMEGRPLVREATMVDFAQRPESVTREEVKPPLRSLWKDPVLYTGRQWGMSIDLSLCTGCNACTVACQAENNIPVVGKRRVIENREMHWIRLDRYFAGSPEDPQVRYQPIPCMHCENAPCEQVCPVMASAHSPEGLNDQAYNRCIGTRYCSNNCPYKVRRFNFFQYNRGIDPLLRMQKNPDVTLRFRGVMEKCTYCVQRIQEAKIQQKLKGTDLIPDGKVLPACAQTCPTGAIVFGDINDENSLVAHRKREPRSYALLAELNNRPRTTYLVKLRNPNPELT